MYCPIPSAIHPRTEAIERDAIAWADGVALPTGPGERGRIVASRSAEWFSRLTPDAVEERLRLAVRWTYWGFHFDDVHCDSADASRRPADFLRRAGYLLHMLEHPGQDAGTGDVFTTALHGIARDMIRLGATDTQMRRFSEGHRAWFLAVAWQMANFRQGIIPSVDDYLLNRQHTIGGGPVVAVFDFVHAQELTDGDFHDPAVKALTEMMFFIGGLDNDLQSLAKEARAAEQDQTITTVLMRQDHIDHAEALRRAVALRDRVTLRFLRLRDRVRARAGDELRQYLDCLAHTVRGTLDWGASAPRYTAHATTRRAARFAERPSDSGDEPLPYTVARGWWAPALG
ncbi:terpene synthase family protein [Kitasatospora sp. NPDC056783]|uniref:terpene synthase family protein n=1 Tax=Kitasatospora sp. NPDC056783 TaxID=3345943 RepID=UPI00369D0A95